LSSIGLNDLDAFSYSVDMAIDKNTCSYTLDVKFKHDENLPLPIDPENQCDPSNFPSALASDGIPYFGSRYRYEVFPESIQKATGVNHISIDFNSCGHPPTDIFGNPHYDFHLYIVEPEFRACEMNCDLYPAASINCDRPSNQQTSNGLGFFNVNYVLGSTDLSNAPTNFTLLPDHVVPNMGAHMWSPLQEPDDTTSWTEPIWVMGNYDGDIAFYEPMIPIDFVTGAEDKYYEEDLTYNGQSIKTLPSKFSSTYDASTKMTTLTFEGQSAVSCDSAPGPKKPKASKANKAKKNGKRN